MSARYVIALFDFDGSRKVDCPQPLLLFHIGDVIEVTTKNPDNYRGRLGTKEGWFPKVCMCECVCLLRCICSVVCVCVAKRRRW